MEKEFWQANKAKGLVVLGVAIWAEGDPLKMAKMFAQKTKVTYTVAYDPKRESKVAEAYKVEGLPVNVVIGRDGKIRYWHWGFDAKSLKQAVETALKEPTPKRTTKGK